MNSPLVVGVNGMIGRSLFHYLESLNLNVTGTTRRFPLSASTLYLEMTDPDESWPQFSGIDVAYLCAGIGRLDACQNDPKTSRLINVNHTVRLVQRLHDAGAFVIFPSTNQVFDGSKALRAAHEAPDPVSEYGRQKVDAENAIRDLEHVAILRISKVISRPFTLFEQWRSDLSAGKSILGFQDLHVAPLPMDSVTEALVAIGEARQAGMYQLSGPRDVSYYEMAMVFARLLGYSVDRVTKAYAIDHGIPADFIPRHTTLANKGLSHIVVPDVEELVRSYVCCLASK